MDEGRCGRGGVQVHEGHAVWGQHAGGGRHRGRQGRSPGQAGLAGQHLGCGRSGQGDGRRHRGRDRRPHGGVPGQVRHGDR